MSRLTPHECRVLGVLVEKAQSTPGQYPLTVNALMSGANQKSNRRPVLSLTEEQVLEALDGLRMKELVRQVMLSGSRVAKYRHVARETLEVSTSELVVLAELLLRGPQTAGELRARASRMHPLESMEVVSGAVRSLMEREEPFVRELPPAAGSRAMRYVQLLCPELHSWDAHPEDETAEEALPGAAERLGNLEAKVGKLENAIRHLASSLGEEDPLAR